MRWNLDDLYTSFDSKEFLDDFEAVKSEIGAFSAWAEENFADASDAARKIEYYLNHMNNATRCQKLFAFASLTRSVDDDNEAAKKYGDQLRVAYTEMAKPEVLFKAFVCALPDVDSVIAQSPVLKEHEFTLKEIRQNGRFMLSDKEELIYAKMRTTGSTAWEDMNNQQLAGLRIPVNVKGEDKHLPLPAVRNLAYDGDAETRKNGYLAELAAYEQVDKAAASALNAIKGEVLTNVGLRGYESPLHMTLHTSRMEKGTLDAMLSAMVDTLPAFRRYFKKKAAVLGHKGSLPFYDLFAPVGKVNMTFSYAEATDFVVKHFSSFSERMGAFTQKAIDSNWVDAEVRAGKRGGAFCSNLHAISQSRVMLNFDGAFGNVSTLAHEFGHAWHGECLRRLPYLNTRYTMPIAETASTFCECIITDAAMQKASGDEKFVILEQELLRAGQVVVDIYSRYLFETAFFEKRKNGPLSVAEINELMLNAQKEAYGDGLDHDCLHKYMWICKNHYYYAERNFYNFPYAYGLLFTLGLYAQYLEEGASFTKKYDKLLSATGANALETVGDMAGINVRTKDFWLSSLKLIERKIEQFCAY